MEDISSYLRDLNAVKVARAAQKEGQVKKAEEDKRKGEEMRRIAMEGSRSMFIVNTYSCVLECVLLLHTERKKSDSTTPSTTPSVESSDVDNEYYEGDEEDPFMDRHKKRKTEKGIILYTVN